MTAGWLESLGDAWVLARTGALRLVSPLEALLRRGRAPQAHLPPLWLRRHAGPVAAFRSSAEQAVELLERLGLLRPGLRILDFGCGPGALLPLLEPRLGADGSYRGLDIHRPSIAWCRGACASDPRFSFDVLGSAGGWPAATAGSDLVLAKSVFTHLLEDAARRSLAEIRRVLAPGGRAVVTAFTYDPERFGPGPLPWFPFPGAGSPVRWRRRSRPTAAVAYERPLFESLVAEAGLSTESFVLGFYPGGSAPPIGQDTLVLAPA
jgi:SAM-dependent methyltransferase